MFSSTEAGVLNGGGKLPPTEKLRDNTPGYFL